MTSDREPVRGRQQEGSSAQPGTAAGPPRSRTLNVVVGVVAALVVVGVVLAATLVGDGEGSGVAAGAPGSRTTDQASPTAEPAEDAVVPQDPAPVDDTCPPGPDAVADPVQLGEVPPPAQGTTTVRLALTCGDVVVVLDGDAAPIGVGSFLGLAEAGFYDQTPCHRLTTQGIFVLQCGDPTGTGTGGPGYSYGPVENAPADDLYPAGTIAMARVGGDGESMGSQFFLVYEDSPIPSDVAGGYTVLGRITEGLQIVRLVAEGGLAGDGVAPARSTGIISVIPEESA